MGLFASMFAFVNRLRYRNASPVGGSLYDFRIRALGGGEIDFRAFKGRKILVVNTASRCVYTPQLDQLQKVHEAYADRVQVIGCPSNDFLWQEPGSSAQIAEFCQRNYGVTFPLSEKLPVTGRSAHPLFLWLASRAGSLPTWNFSKYLVDETGETVLFFSSKTEPLDKPLIDKILE